MMDSKNILKTQRLLVRIDTAEEYKQLFESKSDAELKDYFGLTEESLSIQKGKVKGGMTTYRMSFRMFHLIEKESMKVIGDVAFHNWFAIHSRSEIGYSMKADAFKNKGFMKEALPLIIRYGFEEMKLNRIEAFIHTENMASRRLVEGVGFKEEALLKDHYCDNGIMTDSLVYRLLHKEYTQQTVTV